MPLRHSRALRLFAVAATLLSSQAATAAHRQHVHRAPGAPRLGPWIEEGWRDEDWSRAPAVRTWDLSAPWDGSSSSTEQYPWGYTTPFVRVGRTCVASEINNGPGGEWVRYQRVMPAYYCR